MEDSPHIPNSISNIYHLSNVPTFLYTMMREDEYVKNLSIKEAYILIEEFKNRANKPISTSDAMAYMYAIAIALTYKEVAEVRDFFTYLSTIQFEWFADIAKLYTQRYIPAPIFQSINIEPVNISTSQITINELSKPI